MPLTREERKAIELLIQKANAMSNCLTILEGKVKMLEGLVIKLGDGEITQQDIQDVQAGITNPRTSGSTIPKHNHLTDLEGGDCFAKLGASLIE